MSVAKPSLFLRHDTLLGVCEALGEDFRFNPLPLRIVLALFLLWNPVGILAVYLGLGTLVLLSRLLFPTPRTASARQPAGETRVLAEPADAEPVQLPIAA